MFIKLITSSGICPEFTVVSQKKNDLKYVQGIKVIDRKQLPVKDRHLTLIIATNSRYHKEIIEGLAEYEFKEIMTLDDWLTKWCP